MKSEKHPSRKGKVDASTMMKTMLTALALGQNSPASPCSDALAKSEGDTRRVRVATAVSALFIEKKVLPDVSDLKGGNKDSTVIIRAIIGKDGVVKCTDVAQGDPDLLPRTLDAVKQWRFKPYLLNRQPVIVETPIEFVFLQDKVTAR